MKVAFLSGAYKNAGDFLIEEKAVSLLKYVIPEIEIIRFLRNEITEKINEINDCNAAVIGGGPVYMHDLDGYLPLDECINKLKVPIMILGGGWYGFGGGYSLTYKYKFTPKTLDFLKKVDEEGFGLSCRDIYSVRTLMKEGFKNVYMTGCPAWYNLNKTNQLFLNNPSWEIRNIIVSDPARAANFENAEKVLRYLKEKFPASKITFVFHRGIESDKFTSQSRARELRGFADKIKALNITVRDISYGAEGFHLYDNCDLHVGFRVHAHIYNLSMRNRSVLIEEDGRGAGVNQALGLPALKAYNDMFQIENRNFQKVYRRSKKYPYAYLVEDLDSYLEILRKTQDQYLINAFMMQHKFFDSMISYIKRLSKED